MTDQALKLFHESVAKRLKQEGSVTVESSRYIAQSLQGRTAAFAVAQQEAPADGTAKPRCWEKAGVHLWWVVDCQISH